MRRKTFFAPALLFLILILLMPVKADAAWVKNTAGSYTWYNSSGKKMESQWFAEQNVGFVQNGKTTYCYKKNGGRYKGWLTVGSDRYYVEKTGKVLKSKWIVSGSKRYYASKKGSLYKDCIVKIGEDKFGFDISGAMVTGMHEFNGKTYYFLKANGHMVANALVSVDGKKYYFKPNGVRGTNVWVNGYFIGEEGHNLTSTWVGDRYVGADGKRLTGFQKVDGSYYYFDPETGDRLENESREIDGVTYLFGSDGKGKKADEATETGKPNVSVQSTYYTDPKVDDETLLSAIIYCEAGNQPYYGQLGVGLVITNRMRSTSFPMKLKEVVYQTTQFTPSFDGALTRALNNQSLITESCRQAAAKVLKMYRKDKYTIDVEGKKMSLKGYLFFMTQPAFQRLHLTSKYVKLGDHVFFQSWAR